MKLSSGIEVEIVVHSGELVSVRYRAHYEWLTHWLELRLDNSVWSGPDHDGETRFTARTHVLLGDAIDDYGYQLSREIDPPFQSA